MNKNYYRSLTLALVAAGALTAKADEDLLTKSFPVTAGGKLVMNVDRGSIRITTSDSDKVNVKISRELKNVSAAEAKKIFEQHKIEMISKDNEVRIEAKRPEKITIPGLDNPFNRLQVEYTIAIPSRFDIDLRTAGGHIDVADLEGKAVVNTSGGNLHLGSIKGPLKAHTSGGHITVNKTIGDADVDTSGGDLRLGDILGNVTGHTSGGHITVQKSTGSVKVSTSGGNVRVDDASGPLIAHTSGGNVSARLSNQPKGDCSLKTSGGNVEVQLASNLALDLDAHTSGGRVESDFPGTSNKQKTRLTAQLNGGGPNLMLETSGGNVRIRSAK